jgi:hypothetical protein
MKPKTNKPTAVMNENMVAGQTSFVHPRTLEQITHDFIKKESEKDKKRDGENQYIADFSTVARFLISENQQFSLNTFIELTRNVNTPISSLVPLFNGWLEALESKKRLATIRGCYDFPQYTFR